MYNKFNHYLNKYIENQENKDKSILLAFKGFPNNWLSDLHIKKLFSSKLNIDLTQLGANKNALAAEAIFKLSEGNKLYWCTIEELLTVSQAVIENFYEIHIIKNNLFQHHFPLNYHIENLNNLYENYYLDMEDHIELPEEIQFINTYYGNIKRVKEHFYVSYIYPQKEYSIFPYDDLGELDEVNNIDSYIDISEEEDNFLSLVKELMSNNTVPKEIYLTWKGELIQFSYNYIERINVIRTLYPEIKLSRFIQVTNDMKVDREVEYIKLLKRYWNYDQFRPLKMYKNVDDFYNPKEITHISQSQIVNDLVEQAENAYGGNAYRDIFVTSPTGAGKSIMFQIPAVYLAQKYNMLTIVISPLIGLMKDQVYSLQEKNVLLSATINSEISPVEKMNIVNRIQSGEISILYISPETLLSRSDIKMLIGERKLGLMVIDEAHIVTTWGKAFRSDYWYLGSYLQKLRKEMHFPIATFTATAIYGGIEDMYSETRDSLLMVNPINYFGYVKRDDISVSLKKIKKEISRDQEYRQTKYHLLHERLKRCYRKKKKVLVYFPLVSLIKEFDRFLTLNADEELSSSVSLYYGSLKKEEKNDSFLQYKNGDSLIMLATKAFGMGIDIPDIDLVIHFAPTGNVCDYIQEIGRAARNLEHGKAYFDFLSKDFNHVKRLHGISTIKKTQLIQVMDKILMLYLKDGNKKNARNLLISSEEFRYIFEKNSRSDTDDNLDNKLKTALLIIEKDYINKLGYSPIVARPRSIFSLEFIKVKREIENEFSKYYSRYVQKIKSIDEDYYGGIYKIDLKQLWEEHYKDISFPQFKYFFHQKADQLKFCYIEFIEPVFLFNLDLLNEKPSSTLYKVQNFTIKISEVFSPYLRNQKYIKIDDLATKISDIFQKSRYQAESFANQFIQSMISFQTAININRNHRLMIVKEKETQDGSIYQILPGFNDFIHFINTHIDKLLNMSVERSNSQHELYITKSNRTEAEKTLICLGLMEMLDLLLFEVKGGDNPEIFIRVNSQLQIENDIKNAYRYQNSILNNVNNRHQISVAMLTYLFENEVNTEEFWSHIENYFLGRIPDEVKERVKR